MKKLYLTRKFVSYNKNHAKSLHIRALKHKAWKKGVNISELGHSPVERRQTHHRGLNNHSYKRIIAPINFSFIDNPNEVSSFIYKLKDAFNKRLKVFVWLDDVTKIDYGAIVVLLSIMIKYKSSNIDFDGGLPKNKGARKLLIQSGFFANLYKEFEMSDAYKIGEYDNEGICTHAQKNVDSLLSSQLITNATKTIWGETRRCQGVQRTLIELMQNTNNHASIGLPGEKHWWLSSYHNRKEKIVAFSFVDLGVGIFENLNNKTEKSKWYNWRTRIADRLKYGNNAELLRLILDGSLHRTVTESDFRGKGLPGIAQVLSRNQIQNLHIISNDAYANVSEGRYIKLDPPFDGTFVYWELTKENENKA
ncbi:MAG TPA: hypothetical protein VMV56_10870 [Williamwhitmania sp.]|nr:hypothetical protein [Williamwhitmania sp.]